MKPGMFRETIFTVDDTVLNKELAMITAGMDPTRDHYIIYQGINSTGYAYIIDAYPLLKDATHEAHRHPHQQPRHLS